jgi:serine/threonine protein kinase
MCQKVSEGIVHHDIKPANILVTTHTREDSRFRAGEGRVHRLFEPDWIGNTLTATVDEPHQTSPGR